MGHMRFISDGWYDIYLYEMIITASPDVYILSLRWRMWFIPMFSEHFDKISFHGTPNTKPYLPHFDSCTMM